MSPAPFNALDLLRNEEVRRALASAWRESKPGLADRREEGGFILFDAKDTLVARRWPTGEANKIRVPPHRQCLFESTLAQCLDACEKLPRSSYLQEPGEADRRGVRDDPDLKADYYVGEFVLTDKIIYLVTMSGAIREIANRLAVLT